MDQAIISEEKNIVSTRSVYHDKLLWFFGYPMLAMAMIFIANDNSFLRLISLPSFYSDLLFALVATFLSGFYIKKITLWLDAKKPWHNHLKQRIFMQFVYGILMPLGITMLLEIFYLYIIHIPLNKSSIFYLELPLAFLFLLLANLFYMIHYLFYNEHTRIITLAASKPFIHPDFITVMVGFTERKMPLSDCAVIVSRGKLLWLYTFEEEHYRITGTMDEWEQKLLPVNFYRLNRQILAAHKAIESIEQTSTRKILVHLSLFAGEEWYVSKEKASGFQNWWRNAGTL